MYELPHIRANNSRKLFRQQGILTSKAVDFQNGWVQNLRSQWMHL